ncbi:Thymidylate kinase [Novosphingobium sp. CF614]|uniref:dTMP kinase n=1 Tax=Novosphingobium sp. CF614 TaxID=1884364 RepID=UPI0008E01844|nr:hypothetical protein [Novosphingobium sp. CF614]SFG02046.1 Thymidylate kinase [Novosphingobium sp. CF614]
MMINILGGDGCGKTTQIERLEQWISSDWKLPVRRMAKRDIFDAVRVPECDFFGVPYESLAHKYLPMMRDEARALWLIYMNAVLIRATPPAPGEIVLHDGYWQKHYATEAAMGLDPQWLLDVCRFFPEPDLTILMDIDPRVVVGRGHSHKPYESGCDKTCSDAAFITHQDRVRGYLTAMAKDRHYPMLDANRSADTIFDDLKERLSPWLDRLALTSAIER